MQVAQLWRYPVKSLAGEQLDAADVDERGIVRDRRWAILDVDSGKVLTARRVPELLFARVSRDHRDTIAVVLPDGAVARTDDELSSWLGRRVRLVGAEPGLRGTYESPVEFDVEEGAWTTWQGPAGVFHDSRRTQLSIVSMAATSGWDIRRFRANIVIDQGDERELFGTQIRIGTVRAAVVKEIDRCVMVTRPQPGGIERDLDVMRTMRTVRRDPHLDGDAGSP